MKIIKTLIHKDNILLWIVFVIGIMVALFVYGRLPGQIPMHFNSAGAVDAFGSRNTLFYLPGIMLAMIILAEILKRIDPKSTAYARFPKQYYMVYLLTCLIMLIVEFYIIAVSLDMQVMNINSIIPIAIGIMFILIGNAMPKFKHNYFIGIRTSWTLADEDVWFQTHRMGGKVWVIGGILLIFTFFLPSSSKVSILLIITLVTAFIPIVYSYFIFRKINKKKEN